MKFKPEMIAASSLALLVGVFYYFQIYLAKRPALYIIEDAGAQAYFTRYETFLHSLSKLPEVNPTEAREMVEKQIEHARKNKIHYVEMNIKDYKVLLIFEKVAAEYRYLTG